jgi:hypothetical protein
MKKIKPEKKEKKKEKLQKKHINIVISKICNEFLYLVNLVFIKMRFLTVFLEKH